MNQPRYFYSPYPMGGHSGATTHSASKTRVTESLVERRADHLAASLARASPAARFRRICSRRFNARTGAKTR